MLPRAKEPGAAAAAGRCAAFAADCAACAPHAPVTPPWNASDALAASRRLAGGRERRLAAAGAAPTHSALGDAANAASLRVSPGCERAVPLGIPLITYTNAHHFDILLLVVRARRGAGRGARWPVPDAAAAFRVALPQLRVARESGLECVLERLVTLCLDDGCMKLCKEHDLE